MENSGAERQSLEFLGEAKNTLLLLFDATKALKEGSLVALDRASAFMHHYENLRDRYLPCLRWAKRYEDENYAKRIKDAFSDVDRGRRVLLKQIREKFDVTWQ